MSTLIKYLQELAIATRLKMLSESLLQDVRKIYKEQHINFEPRWFLTFYQLSKQSPMAITELSEAIGITHSAINQIATELINEGLIETSPGIKDKRKRFLNISNKGKDLLLKLNPVWDIIEQANKEVIENANADFLKSLEKIEIELSRKSMYNRINEILSKKFDENLSIIDFKPGMENRFKTINHEWLKKYFTIEEIDEKLLNHPHEMIIKKGGAILFASLKGEIIGTCALIKHNPGIYELSKMGVCEEFQGKQVGKKLAIAIIEKAMELGAKELFLITHEKLLKAISLYKSLGFAKTNDFNEIHYGRGGITMKLELKR